MKQLLLLVLIFGINISLQAQKKQTHVVKIKTSAVCEMCKYAIEKELAYEKGVISADLDVNSKILTISFQENKTSLETIKQRIAKIGYDADDIKKDEISYQNLPDCCKIESKAHE